MRVTVAICTRNRAGSLARVLRSAEAMTPHAGGAWELVVVDNGSSDHTGEVVAGFAPVLPVRRVVEPTPPARATGPVSEMTTLG